MLTLNLVQIPIPVYWDRFHHTCIVSYQRLKPFSVLTCISYFRGGTQYSNRHGDWVVNQMLTNGLSGLIGYLLINDMQYSWFVTELELATTYVHKVYDLITYLLYPLYVDLGNYLHMKTDIVNF